MASPHAAALAALPSVDRMLRHSASVGLVSRYGRQATGDAIRSVLEAARLALEDVAVSPDDETLLARVGEQLRDASRPSLRRVFNLTGVVLHTNLGRAILPAAAVKAVALVAAHPSNLEFDLDSGRRGQRGEHIEAKICRLTGADAAVVVNNNAAAVLLMLNTLALRREVVTSRGELVEIGDSFRMPAIMTRAGCRLREVGTTNRTHLSDYADAIGPKTGLVLKVHTSNFKIEGFASSVAERDLARLCHDRDILLATDLGSGSLLDLRQYGLPHEPTPSEVLADGVDIVTFSGDKLLGGPQAGIIVGRSEIVARMRRNPMMRALRLDKLTLAALSAVLDLYSNPDQLAERLPVLRVLTRPQADIEAAARRLREPVATSLAGIASVEVTACESEVGSGALPTRTVPSAGLSIRPIAARRGSGAALERITRMLRKLPIPVIGRRQKGTLILDLRCLEDESGFAAQLSTIDLTGR